MRTEKWILAAPLLIVKQLIPHLCIMLTSQPHANYNPGDIKSAASVLSIALQISIRESICEVHGHYAGKGKILDKPMCKVVSQLPNFSDGVGILRKAFVTPTHTPTPKS